MENSNRTILVTGATGHQGSAVAHHLLKRGNFQVRALVRDKNKPAAQSLKRLGAELFVGDLDQQASLEHALQNVFRCRDSMMASKPKSVRARRL